MSDKEDKLHVSHALQTSFTSLIQKSEFGAATPLDIVWLSNFSLLRVLVTPYLPLEAIFQHVNSRLLCCFWTISASELPFSKYQLWNLQTLYLQMSQVIVLPSEIWEMPQLRHLNIESAYFPDLPNGRMDWQDVLVLKKLQTLSSIWRFRCTEEVLRKIPNIKKLKVLYEGRVQYDLSHYCLNNFGRLHKLQSFSCSFPLDVYCGRRTDFFQNLNLPLSLKKLTLDWGVFDWEDVTTKIGSLPYLEMLELHSCFGRKVWNTVHGKFLSLKFLEIKGCNLECWTTEDETHFPCLKQLNFIHMSGPKRIPSYIGDIASLRSIDLKGCSESVVDSAREILEEQHGM